VNENKNKRFHIEKSGDVLVFSTTHYSAETGSVLHSGIYNREFASVLASLSVAGSAYLALTVYVGKTLVSHLTFMLVFIACFPFFRKFVFKERRMRTVFDRTRGKVELFLTGMMRRRLDSFPLKDIVNVMVESRKTEIENPDGVKFVEKISLQHGMAIPGFGEEKVFFLLKLILADGAGRVIYADNDAEDVIAAHGEIKEFLKI
jgi:hypothetical protein